jgi:hypothetical protein
MALSDPKRLTADAFLVLFAGLAVAACQKSTPEVTPEKAGDDKQAVAVTAAPKPSGTVEAKEVPAPAASGSAAGEKSCAAGGCAPGKCGGKDK